MPESRGSFRPVTASAHPQIVALRDSLFGKQKPALVALAAGVLLLLLLACANVANLTLGHLAERRAELTMRTLLGASGWRVIQQQLAQSLVIAAAGGAAGLAAVVWSLPTLVALYARDGTTSADVHVDWRVIAFASAAIVATAVLSGVLPAVRFCAPPRRAPAHSLRHAPAAALASGGFARRWWPCRSQSPLRCSAARERCW